VLGDPVVADAIVRSRAKNGKTLALSLPKLLVYARVDVCPPKPTRLRVTRTKPSVPIGVTSLVTRVDVPSRA
jgi:hypothetical protein